MGLAYFCAREGLRSCVIEQSTRLGGAIHTERPTGGLWIEMGAHTCYNSYGRLLDIAADCDLLARLRPRKKLPWKIWDQGRVQSVTSHVNWLELLRSLPRLAVRNRERESVAEYYAAVLGRRNFNKVALPMLSAVVSQDATNFPAAMLFKKRPRRKGIVRSFTLAGGLQTLPEAMAAAGGFTVKSGIAAQQVAMIDDGWQVATSDGATHHATALALAVPPGSAAKLMQPAMPKLAEKLAQIRECKVDSVGVVVRKDRVKLPLVAGLVGKNTFFRSLITRDVVEHPDLRGFVFHSGSIGSDQERLHRAVEFLEVRQGDLEYVAHKSQTIPSPGMAHASVIAALQRLVAGKRIALTGNYFSGMALEDCLERSALEAQRLAILM